MRLILSNFPQTFYKFTDFPSIFWFLPSSMSFTFFHEFFNFFCSNPYFSNFPNFFKFHSNLPIFQKFTIFRLFSGCLRIYRQFPFFSNFLVSHKFTGFSWVFRIFAFVFSKTSSCYTNSLLFFELINFYLYLHFSNY